MKTLAVLALLICTGIRIYRRFRFIKLRNRVWNQRLKDRKGGNWNEWPDDLRVRQFPFNVAPPAQAPSRSRPQ